MATLFKIFCLDMIDILDFMALAGFIGNAIEHLVLLLEIFKLFLPFVFGILILIQIISPTYHRSSHSILDVTVGTHARKVLVNMKRIISLRHS